MTGIELGMAPSGLTRPLSIDGGRLNPRWQASIYFATSRTRQQAYQEKIIEAGFHNRKHQGSNIESFNPLGLNMSLHDDVHSISVKMQHHD
jgi:hypothetical protein